MNNAAGTHSSYLFSSPNCFSLPHNLSKGSAHKSDIHLASPNLLPFFRDLKLFKDLYFL
jgi:hypothetical protein